MLAACRQRSLHTMRKNPCACGGCVVGGMQMSNKRAEVRLHLTATGPPPPRRPPTVDVVNSGAVRLAGSRLMLLAPERL